MMSDYLDSKFQEIIDATQLEENPSPYIILNLGYFDEDEWTNVMNSLLKKKSYWLGIILVFDDYDDVDESVHRIVSNLHKFNNLEILQIPSKIDVKQIPQSLRVLHCNQVIADEKSYATNVRCLTIDTSENQKWTQLPHGNFPHLNKLTLKSEFPDCFSGTRGAEFAESINGFGRLERLEFPVGANSIQPMLGLLTLKVEKLGVPGCISSEPDYGMYNHEVYLPHLSKLCSSTVYLNLSWTSMTNNEIVDLAIECPYLQTICIDGYTFPSKRIQDLSSMLSNGVGRNVSLVVANKP